MSENDHVSTRLGRNGFDVVDHKDRLANNIERLRPGNSVRPFTAVIVTADRKHRCDALKFADHCRLTDVTGMQYHRGPTQGTDCFRTKQPVRVRDHTDEAIVHKGKRYYLMQRSASGFSEQTIVLRASI